MPANDTAIIDYLVKNYGSSISKRALWMWSGGAEADIDYDLPPLNGWGLMWEKADKNPVPTRIGLVREMLFDFPGEEILLDYLDALSADRFKAEKEIVEFFLFLLAKNPVAENRLAVLLYLLQDMSPDCILATTAPSIQAARDDTLYDDLETTLPKFDNRRVTLSTELLVEWIAFYFEGLMDDVAVAPVTLEKARQAKERLSKLKALVADATAPEDAAAPEEKPPTATAAGGADDKDTDELEERKAAFKEAAQALDDQIEDLKAQPPESGAGFFAPVVTVVAALLELLNESGLEGEKISLALSAVEPLRAALWATRPKRV